MLRDRAVAAFGENHQDIDRVNLVPVPVLLVAHHFDQFKDQDVALLKIMARCVRLFLIEFQ